MIKFISDTVHKIQASMSAEKDLKEKDIIELLDKQVESLKKVQNRYREESEQCLLTWLTDYLHNFRS